MAFTIGTIANKIAKYLGQSRARFLDEAGNDLIISAITAAKNDAQLMHDFTLCKCQAAVSVDPDLGGNVLTSAFLLVPPITITTTPVNVMSVDTVYIQDQVNQIVWWPLDLKEKKTLAIKAKEQNYLYRGYPNPYGMYLDSPLARFATDPRNLWPTRPLRAYWQGTSLFLDPRVEGARNVKMDVSFWMNDYLANTNVSVASASTTSSTVTLTADAPVDMVPGTYFLGQLVVTANPSSTSVTLAGHSNQNITTATVPYSNVGVDPSTGRYFVNNEDYTDWFITRGQSYVFYTALIESNMTALRFVERSEGFLSATAPQKAADIAWTKLVEWDNFMITGGMQYWTMR